MLVTVDCLFIVIVSKAEKYIYQKNKYYIIQSNLLIIVNYSP